MDKSLAVLRDRKTDTATFRAAAEKLCALLMRDMKTLLRKHGVAEKDVALVTILRSGVALVPPALRAFPGARVGVLGLKRDERTFVARWYYENLPPLSKRSAIVILDPMLATGGTTEAAVARLVERGAAPEHIYFIGVIAASEGFERLARLIPEKNIVLAAIDKKLDARKLIVPGLGDFGDRYFGYLPR